MTRSKVAIHRVSFPPIPSLLVVQAFTLTFAIIALTPLKIRTTISRKVQRVCLAECSRRGSGIAPLSLVIFTGERAPVSWHLFRLQPTVFSHRNISDIRHSRRHASIYRYDLIDCCTSSRIDDCSLVYNGAYENFRLPFASDGTTDVTSVDQAAAPTWKTRIKRRE